MKPVIVFTVLIFLLQAVFAQQDNPGETAKAFIRQGDYTNAVLVLNRAIENDRSNAELKKDLAFVFYLQRDYTKSVALIKPLSETSMADVQTFQILGMNYKAIEERKEAEKMYKEALKKFPENGALLNEYGEILWSRQELSGAVDQWKKGIQSDPNYSGNYYNAAKYYYLSADKVWGLIYGELFVNLESYSKRTAEIKNLLLEGYKKLFTETDMLKNQDGRNDFVKAYITTMKNQSQVIGSGITPESLSALRTRFILEWFGKNEPPIPFRLFEYQRQLAKSGLFDAYNQWIFGAADNLSAFQQWTVIHNEEYNKFNTFQKNRIFKVPEGQMYQK